MLSDMFNTHVLVYKDLQDIKEIKSGYLFGSEYVVFIKIKYNKWWKLPKVLKFYDYSEANKIYNAIQKLILLQ